MGRRCTLKGKSIVPSGDLGTSPQGSGDRRVGPVLPSDSIFLVVDLVPGPKLWTYGIADRECGSNINTRYYNIGASNISLLRYFFGETFTFP